MTLLYSFQSSKKFDFGIVRDTSYISDLYDFCTGDMMLDVLIMYVLVIFPIKKISSIPMHIIIPIYC